MQRPAEKAGRGAAAFDEPAHDGLEKAVDDEVEGGDQSFSRETVKAASRA